MPRIAAPSAAGAKAHAREFALLQSLLNKGGEVDEQVVCCCGEASALALWGAQHRLGEG